MKDYLENLEIGEGKVKLSKDEIKSILTEHGKVITTETERVKNSLNNEINTYKTTITNLENQIKDMPSSDDVSKLQKEIQDMKDAEQERIANEQKAKEESIRQERINEFFKDTKFSSEMAKNGVISEFKKKEFKYDEETKSFQGATEWLNNLKESDKGSFLSDVANPKFTTTLQAPVNTGSMDSIRKAMGLKIESEK